MGLKRKRSSEDTSSPSSLSVSSFASSSPSPSPWQPAPSRTDVDAQMELCFPVSKPFRHMDDHEGRTRKRWRSRPNEDAIHEHTIQKLFDAQRQRPHAEPVPSSLVPSLPSRPPQRSTLHEFWNIRRPQPIFATPAALEETPSLLCDDCDRALALSDVADQTLLEPRDLFSCLACGKAVCDFCAVNVDGRRCLDCVHDCRA
ncbi:uncharacterized protein PV09_07034 [Verruconis gallopava]|uniref:Uncharacterized protein n=1 Tax=Verruconis gallopava TaxID=253628 RepID=A0A0D2A438_9PEZI|nr:uncharacterized protein PV09_07034 [Verruconis gallopava]KIW01558.1 hypothetical protein PV09_07034 [Verruconis gallopava]